MPLDAGTLTEQFWPQLQDIIDITFRTPDNSVGKPFIIHSASANIDHITIRTNTRIEDEEPNTRPNVRINRAAFIAALDYLIINDHTVNRPCIIKARNDSTSGPLCTETKIANGGVRCIDYILPILQYFNLVGINGKRLNETWLIDR